MPKTLKRQSSVAIVRGILAEQEALLHAITQSMDDNGPIANGVGPATARKLRRRIEALTAVLARPPVDGRETSAELQLGKAEECLRQAIVRIVDQVDANKPLSIAGLVTAMSSLHLALNEGRQWLEALDDVKVDKGHLAPFEHRSHRKRRRR